MLHNVQNFNGQALFLYTLCDVYEPTSIVRLDNFVCLNGVHRQILSRACRQHDEWVHQNSTKLR